MNNQNSTDITGIEDIVNFDNKGWKLKNIPFSFYPWCIQSDLFLVKHGQ